MGSAGDDPGGLMVSQRPLGQATLPETLVQSDQPWLEAAEDDDPRSAGGGEGADLAVIREVRWCAWPG